MPAKVLLASLAITVPMTFALSSTATAQANPSQEASPAEQAWHERVQQAWPGDTLGKATQHQFESWLQIHLDQAPHLDAALGKRVFLRDQYAFHGLTTSGGSTAFLSPSVPVAAPDDGAVDALVTEAPEPNAANAQATAMACSDQGEGRVFPFGDRDAWSITLTASAQIEAWTSGRSAGNPAETLGDTMIELRDAAGTLLIANDDAPGFGRYSYIALTVNPGTYYITVRGYVDVRRGGYGLDVRCGAPNTPGGVVPEGPEPNQSPTTAAAFDCGLTGQGNIQSGNDEDWFAVTITSAGTLEATTGPGTSNILDDTTLTLYSSTGSQLAFNDDAIGLYSRITMALQPGTYYYGVGSFSTGTGTYELFLSCGSGNLGTPTWTAMPGGCPGSQGTVPDLAMRPGELPILGSTFTVDLTTPAPNQLAIPFLGLSNTMTGGMPLPMSLAPLGAPGCFLEVDPAVNQVGISDGLGRLAFGFGIPIQANLIGLSFYQQALVYDPAANVARIVLSNSGVGVIGVLP